LDPFLFLDADGNQVSSWQQPGTGPVPSDARKRAQAVILSDLK